MSSTMTDEGLYAALEQHFGYGEFREGQAATIKKLLGGSDVVLVMPTGSGKSLCYQLTAMLLPGATIVVSPLIALMKDQVDALVARGIAATCLNSMVGMAEMNERLDGVRRGRYKLIYVAPERFRNQRFMQALASAQIALFTIDEAHCVSQWGHDFRPDYLYLRQVIKRLERVPVLAVTATATPDVREDIIKQLGLGSEGRAAPKVDVTGFARENLYLAVSRCATHRMKFSRLVQAIEQQRCGIVYCATRKMVERVTKMLKEDGMRPISYHGAMGDSERNAAQDRFMQEGAPVVVATNAFGMGVDRADIRFVVHWDIPGSLEAYYQEVGRAGRDGAAAWCDLLFNYADVATQQFFLDGANPPFADVLMGWEAVKSACMEQEVTCSIEDWAQRAQVKNSMAMRTILVLLERAKLIEREIMVGNRSYTTRLVPNADTTLKELRRQAAGLDAKRQSDERKLKTLLRFVDHTGCRHAYLLNYFGEQPRFASCGYCDRCVRGRGVGRVPAGAMFTQARGGARGGAREVTAKAPSERQWIVIQKVLSCVVRMKGRFGATRVAQVLRGERDAAIERHGLEQLTTYGLLPEMSVGEIRAVIEALRADGSIAVSPDEYACVSLTMRGRKVMLRELSDFVMVWPIK